MEIYDVPSKNAQLTLFSSLSSAYQSQRMFELFSQATESKHECSYSLLYLSSRLNDIDGDIDRKISHRTILGFTENRRFVVYNCHVSLIFFFFVKKEDMLME